MSTRSFIGMIEDHVIRGIYCHFDGYIQDGVGQKLFENYQNDDKIRELINLGAISFLEAEVNPTDKHTFDNPQSGVTVAYHRDRGEDLDIDEFDNINDFDAYIAKSWYDYIYLRFNGKWFVVQKRNGEFVGVPLCEENIKNPKMIWNFFEKNEGVFSVEKMMEGEE